MPDGYPPVEVGRVYVADVVTWLYGFPLRRFGPDFTPQQGEEVMENAVRLSAAGQGIPLKAYHRDTRAGSPLTGLPRGEDGVNVSAEIQ